VKTTTPTTSLPRPDMSAPVSHRDAGGSDPATLIGIVFAVVCLLIMMIMEGSSPMSIILIPPLILIFGGTFGAAVAGMPMSDVKKIPSFFKAALLPQTPPSPAESIETLVKLSEHARKNGLLALENEAKDIENDFLKRGLQMLADSMDPEDVRDILEAEIESKRAADKVGAKFFEAQGGYAPTIGIIGTVVGLIHVLENLSQPEKLGHLIAGAFVATLWGVLSANVLWLPMGNKISRITEQEIAVMELLVEGICEIQAGTGPRAVRQKLTALIPPSQVAKEAA
jgi:chemotaxis protein MotA